MNFPPILLKGSVELLLAIRILDCDDFEKPYSDSKSSGESHLFNMLFTTFLYSFFEIFLMLPPRMWGYQMLELNLGIKEGHECVPGNGLDGIF